MKILSLKAENVKRLVAVEIKPGKNVVEIAGKNGAGKSSVIDSIAYAIGGKNLCPAKPIREGRKNASVCVDIGDFVVERTWKASGSTSLKVKTRDGLPCKAPQQILDGLVGSLTFDPLAFSNMKAAEQRETMIGFLGIRAALEKCDADLKQLRSDKHAASASVRRLDAEIDAAEDVPADTPDNPVDMADLQKQLRAATTTNSTIDAARRSLSSKTMEIQGKRYAISSLQLQIEREKKIVKVLESDLANIQQQVKDLGDPVDTDAIHDAMASANQTNEAVAEKQRVAKLRAECDKVEKEQSELDAQIEERLEERERLMTEATYPIKGLGFDEDGVTFDGQPWEQLSQALRLRISVAMGMALNPNLKVLLVRDGSLLDDDSYRALQDAVTRNDYQLWIERVGAGSETAIVIEDGKVK